MTMIKKPVPKKSPREKTIKHSLYYINQLILAGILTIFVWFVKLISLFRFIPGLHLLAIWAHNIQKLYRLVTKYKEQWKTIHTVFLIGIVASLALITAALMGTMILGTFLVAPKIFITAMSIGGILTSIKLISQIYNYCKHGRNSGVTPQKIVTSACDTFIYLSMPVVMGFFFFVPGAHLIAGIALVALAATHGLVQLGKLIYKKYQERKEANPLLTQKIKEDESLLNNEDNNQVDLNFNQALNANNDNNSQNYNGYQPNQFVGQHDDFNPKNNFNNQNQTNEQNNIVGTGKSVENNESINNVNVTNNNQQQNPELEKIITNSSSLTSNNSNIPRSRDIKIENNNENTNQKLNFYQNSVRSDGYLVSRSIEKLLSTSGYKLKDKDIIATNEEDFEEHYTSSISN